MRQPLVGFRVVDGGRLLASSWRFVGLAIVLTLLLGEVYMRLPFVLPRLEYEPDRELDGRLAPRQHGYVWLANMSLQSPAISINREGHRGVDREWRRPTILVVGDSEWFGAGVDDDEVWTSQLESDLNSPSREKPVQVVNASHPGFGPFHQAMVIERLLARHAVDAILVRVSPGQHQFRPVPEGERDGRVAAAHRRATLRRWTKFLPFLVNKLEAQVPAIRAALTPHVLQRRREPGEGLSVAVGRAMAAEAMPWWQRMADHAEAKGAPLVFVVHDPVSAPAAAPLEAALRSVAAAHRAAHVVRLGPEAFGLDPTAPTDQLRRALRTRLTIGLDPHANVLQHRLIAQALGRALHEMEIPALR